MTTPKLAPCPVCGSAPATRIGVSGLEIAMCVNPDCPDELSCEADQWICRADMIASRCARAWEQGRDAAARILKDKWEDYAAHHGIYDPSTGVTEYPGDGDEWVAEWQETEDEIRALTPPADLASGERRAPVSPRPEITEAAQAGAIDAAEWVAVAGCRLLPPGWPDDAAVERASEAAWDSWNDANDHQAQGWPAWQSLHPVQAMEWREVMRAALTAALTDGESNG